MLPFDQQQKKIKNVFFLIFNVSLISFVDSAVSSILVF